MLASDRAAETEAWRSGLAALAAGAPASAVPLLQRAAAAGEGGGLAFLNLGLALMQLGRLDEAEPALARAAMPASAAAAPSRRSQAWANSRAAPT